jgi:hypothetical protein
LRHGKAERRGGLQIDHELECGRLLDRQIGRLLALEDPSGGNAALARDSGEDLASGMQTEQKRVREARELEAMQRGLEQESSRERGERAATASRDDDDENPLLAPAASTTRCGQGRRGCFFLRIGLSYRYEYAARWHLHDRLWFTAFNARLSQLFNERRTGFDWLHRRRARTIGERQCSLQIDISAA